jgi:acylphosphatase
VSEQRARRRVTVRGQVQGVFFRDSVRERARAEGVDGWICNRGDGAVEAVIEGDPEAVERLVQFCRTGPSQADVERVDVREEDPEGLSGFEVR